MAALPTGTVTFLFTDLEVSTRLWDQEPDAMRAALARHDAILRAVVGAHGGWVVKGRGDGVHAVFATADGAIGAAIDAQVALGAEAWAVSDPLRVRMGIHSGVAELRDGDYFGAAVNRAARLDAVAHGGQIVCSQATADLVRDSLAGTVELVDLGEHTLRDLSRPERVFQVSAPGLGRVFPSLASLDASRGNLPSPITSFVGRQTEIRSVAGALAEARLVTITGVGGVGKTRLALQVAAEVLGRYRDGAWLCELAAAEDADTIVQVVGSTLGVVPRPQMSLRESIVDFLRVKQMLIVLDNCEHMLGSVAALGESVLRGCGEVRLLATSREVLSVPGEQVVELRSLSLPRRSDPPAEILASDAVALFVERARAVRSTFGVDPQNAGAVAEICWRLDGIPLAIELAAARIAAMSAAEIGAHLDERFRLLQGGKRTALERHQTLRATVDWSYSLLSDAERVVFERLGAFGGAFDAPDACAVANGDGIEEWDVLDALASLVAKSMLVADEDDDGVTRYQMLETIRAYARERLDDQGAPDRWRRRHAEHYTRFSVEARDALLGPEELAWRRRLRAELDNVRAAVFWSLDSNTPGDHQFVLTIIANLASEVEGDRASGYGSWAARALPFTDEATPGQRAAILGAAAFDAFRRGDLDRARTLAEEAVGGGVPVDCPCPSLPFVALASPSVATGRHADADAIMTAALEHAEAIRQHPPSEAILLGVRSLFRSVGGNTDRARADAAASLTHARRIGNPLLLVVALSALGYAWIAEDPARAREAFEESVALTQSGASDVNYSLALRELARLRMRDGDPAAALDALRAAVTYDNAGGNRPALPATLLASCELLTALGHLEHALVLNGAVVEGELRPLAPGTSAVGSQHAALVRAPEGLGDAAYQAALAKGSALSYEEVVAYALDAIDTARAELEKHHD
jgi:predicted ATPase/class 3 adenylate cyclase